MKKRQQTINIVDDEPYTLIGMKAEIEDLFDDTIINEYQNPVIFLEKEKIVVEKTAYVIDYNMKPLNGYDTIMRMWENSGFEHFDNVILYTGNAAYLPDTEIKTLMNLGVAILEKGTGKNELFKKIGEILGGVE